jgi:hypothetical protein
VFYYEFTAALAIVHVSWCMYWLVQQETMTTEDVVEEYVQLQQCDIDWYILDCIWFRMQHLARTLRYALESRVCVVDLL